MKKKGLQLKQTLSKLQEITAQQQPSYLQPQSNKPEVSSSGNKRTKKNDNDGDEDDNEDNEEEGEEGEKKDNNKPKRRRIGNNDLKVKTKDLKLSNIYPFVSSSFIVL